MGSGARMAGVGESIPPQNTSGKGGNFALYPVGERPLWEYIDGETQEPGDYPSYPGSDGRLGGNGEVNRGECLRARQIGWPEKNRLFKPVYLALSTLLVFSETAQNTARDSQQCQASRRRNRISATTGGGTEFIYLTESPVGSGAVYNRVGTGGNGKTIAKCESVTGWV